MTAPTLSVIIPVRNGGPVFKRCLAAVASSTLQPLEFFVVDDGSTDGTAQLAQQAGATVLSTNSPGSGPAIARNLAAARATGDILFFFDSDVEIRPDTLARIQAAFADDPALAALFGSYDDTPGDPGFLSQYRNLFHHYVHQQGNEAASTFWSGCGAMRRDIFLSYGGFSSNYKLPAIEDIELGYVLRRAGYQIRLDKTLLVKHLKRWTLFSLLHSDIVARGIPWTRLLLREGAFLDDLNLQIHNRLSVVLIYLALLCLGFGFWYPIIWFGALLVPWLLLWLNFPLYQFMAAKRGWRFGLASIGPHWLYYAYNGVSFGIGSLLHLIEREPKPGRRVIAGKHKRTFALAMGGILVMALFFRVHNLGELLLPSEEALRVGDQSFWLRMGSAMASVLTVALLYRFTGRAWGRGVGTVVAALLGASAFHVSAARVATPYALVSLLALLSFHSLLRALKTNRYDSWIAYVVNTSLCLAAYSPTLFVLLSQLLVVVTYLGLAPGLSGARKRLISFGLAVCSIVLASVVLLEVGGGQSGINSGAILFVTPGAANSTRMYDLLQDVINLNVASILFAGLALAGVIFAFWRDRRFSSLLLIWAIVPGLLMNAYHLPQGWNLLELDLDSVYLVLVVFMAIGIVGLGTALERQLPRWKLATWITVVAAPLLMRAGQLAAYYDSFK